MIPEGTMQVFKIWKQPTVLHSYDAYELQGKSWSNGPKNAVVAPVPCC